MSSNTYRHSDDPKFNQFQQSTLSDLKQLRSAPLASGRVIADIDVTSGTEKAVETGLPRAQGYALIRSNVTGMTVYDNGIEGGTIRLVADATGRISLVVF